MGPRGDDRLDADELASRFEVVQRYPGGEGWSAAVRDRASGATRFLKILDPGVEVVEASLLASLAHPRIPRVLELGTTRDGRAWLLREHFAGVPTQLLETLAYVHLRGILHLDLKPANVLRCGIPEQPTYALLDFGLGRRGSGPATGGTAFFAAPERLLGMEPDARSDLFSLGAFLFVALRSSGPSLPWTRFCARFPREDFFAAVGTPARELPAPFADFLARLLHRRPNDRPADAQEALESLVGGTGRPSIGVLRPDPIRVFGARLERMVEGLEPGRDVAIFGGDASARHALAVHVACTLDGVAECATSARCARCGVAAASRRRSASSRCGQPRSPRTSSKPWVSRRDPPKRRRASCCARARTLRRRWSTRSWRSPSRDASIPTARAGSGPTRSRAVRS